MFPTVQNSITDLKQALAQETKSTSVSTGVNYLTFAGKRNAWEYGQDKEDVAGQKLLINSASFTHGWVLWHQRRCTTAMVSIMKDLPEELEAKTYTLPNGKDKTDYPSEGRGFQGKWLDSDEVVSFESGSMGGKNAVQKVIDQVKMKAMSGSDFIFPVVELDSYDYVNNNGDQVFSPSLNIVQWLDAEGNEEGGALPDPEEKKPATRRRRA